MSVEQMQLVNAALKTASAALDPGDAKAFRPMLVAAVEQLANAQLLQSPETAAELERLRAQVATAPTGLSSEQRTALAEQLGNAKPAQDSLIVSFAKSIQDVREHEHPKWEDLFCLNLTSYMGERMAPVLRRLLDVETEADQLHSNLMGANLSLYEEEQDTARLRLALKSAQRGRRELRARVVELEAQAATKDRPVDEDPITYALTPKARQSSDRLQEILAEQRAQVTAEGGA